MLGTHNSFSYRKPRKRWMLPLRWTAQCQTKTIAAQLAAGAVCLDARVRPTDRADRWVFAHGPVEYAAEGADCAFDELAALCANGGLRRIRLILDSKGTDEEDAEDFRCAAAKLRKHAESHGVEVTCCRRKSDWLALCDWAVEPATDQHAVGSMRSWYDKIWPWLWTRLNGEEKAKAVQLAADAPDASVLTDFI